LDGENMSLGIFSFDLAALINSLSDIINIANDKVAPAEVKTSLDKAADILQTAIVKHSEASDAQMATALNSAVTSVITTLETGKNTDQKPTPTNPEPLPSKVQLDDETKREIERIIQSLQTSVNFSYQSTDLINDSVYRNNVNNFLKNEMPKESDRKNTEVENEKKQQQVKENKMQEELKKAIFKHNLQR
jgi:hypothetical protein